MAVKAILLLTILYMFSLDIRTSYFFAFVSHGLLAAILASFWYARRAEKGLTWWIADGLQLSFASLLLLLWGSMPSGVIFVGSNLLIFANLPTIESGLRAFFRERVWPGLASRWIVATFIFFAWTLTWSGGWTYAQRVVGFSAVFLIQLGLFLAYLLNLKGARIRLAQGLMLFAIFLVGASVLIRMGYVLRHMESVTAIRDDWLLPVLTFSAIFAAFVRTCSVLLLMHGRAEQRMRAAHRDIEHRANYDQQTGVMSRSYFEIQAQAAFDERSHPSRSVALLLLDVDNFKRVNDTFGHLEGDEILGKVGQVLRHNARGQDLVGRLGGDEFAMLLRDVTVEEAVTVAERILRQATEVRMPSTQSISLSIGICSHSHTQNFEAVYRLADAALYSAKHAGRGRVVAHDPLSLRQIAAC